MNKIKTYNESDLHQKLKEYYFRKGDEMEKLIDGFYIDLVQGDHLIEFQTKNFRALRRKLQKLLKSHKVKVVFPIARIKRILKRKSKKHKYSKPRKSPKKGVFFDLFHELISISPLLNNPAFSLEVVFIEEFEKRIFDKNKTWRRNGWVIEERCLHKVLDSVLINNSQDLFDYVFEYPVKIEFTTKDIAEILKIRINLARKIVYCFKKMDLIEKIGSKRKFYLYQIKKA